jgi:hypothetical protein
VTEQHWTVISLVQALLLSQTAAAAAPSWELFCTIHRHHHDDDLEMM